MSVFNVGCPCSYFAPNLGPWIYLVFVFLCPSDKEPSLSLLDLTHSSTSESLNRSNQSVSQSTDPERDNSHFLPKISHPAIRFFRLGLASRFRSKE